MKTQDVMEADEKFVKSNEADAKTLFNNNHTLIKPIVVSPDSGNPKVGKGWSMDEIKAAGLTRKQLRALHLRIDRFRRTTHQDNVELLKKFGTAGFLKKKKSGKAKK